MNDELISFDDEAESSEGPGQADLLPWDILIVDDEPDIHLATQWCLSSVHIHGRPIRFHNAYSGTEARDAMGGEKRFNLILLDAVMETPNAGLDFARHVRETVATSEQPVIVLRSGQVGMLTDRQVSEIGCIDSFLAKADVTSERLISVLDHHLPSSGTATN